MDNDHLKIMEKEGSVEAPGAEVFKSSIRKSARLQTKKHLSSCSKYVFKSYHSKSKYTKKSLKTANTESMKSSTVVPSFQYDVRANDGIGLVVDLNFKRSDWLKSMEKSQKTLYVCQDRSNPAFVSFRKEIECLGNRNNLKVSSTDKTSASDATTMNSYVQNMFSIKSTSREDGETLPSVVEDEVITVTSVSGGSKGCWSKVDQNSEVVVESFENSTTEVNQEAGGGHQGRSTVENEERNNSAEGMEVSGSEENAYVISASDDGPKRKKHDYKSDHIHGQSHERILRSTKFFGGKILERDGIIVWRSSRLHSK